jgi:hypothetical protein
MGSAWSFRRGLLLSVAIPVLWAEEIRLQAIAAPATASIAASSRDAFLSDGEFASEDDQKSTNKKNPHILATDVETSGGVTKMQSLLC